MKNLSRRSTGQWLTALCVLAAAALPLSAQSVIYGLTPNNALVLLSGDFGKTIPGPALTGMAQGESVVAIDFRPLTGELYALSRDDASMGAVYTVNPTSGVMTPVALSGPPLILNGSVDIDFNPAALAGVNALRIVTGNEQNYRLVFTADGATVNVDAALNVPGGASGTNIIATAYANNRAGMPGGGGAGGTVQYAIDSDTDTLYRVNPPNNGVLTNGLPLGIDLTDAGGLDLVTGTDRALGVFTVAGVAGLYEVNLKTGAATLVNGLSSPVIDLAVPLPATAPTRLVYGLTGTNSLVRFSAEGGPVVYHPGLTGIGVGETLVGLDFRPFTGALYALSIDGASQGHLYTVDPASNTVTPVALSGQKLTLTGSVGMDFNPAALSGTNALRIVTSDEQNYRLVFTTSGATVNVDGSLNVPGGSAGTHIIATAYSNNRAGLPAGAGVGGTVQYVIDSDTDTLYRVNPPNNGVLTNGLPLGVDIGSVGGLDIVTGTDRALGLFTTAGSTLIYQINLATGSATPVRFLPEGIIDLAAALPSTIPSTVIVALTATNSLVTFNTDGTPVGSGPTLTGLGAGETVVAIDFRPFTGTLYTLSRDASNLGRLYTADPASGVLTPVQLSGPDLNLSGDVDMDFNPAAVTGTNALRIVTSDKQNYRLVFTAAGATVNVDGALNATGMSSPQVVATAYSNNRSGLPGGAGVGGTSQYAIEAGSLALYRVNPPNNGILTEAKAIGLKFRSVAGFDITTLGDRALAILDVEGSSGLYEISLATGAATYVRSLPSSLIDLAVPTPIRLNLEYRDGAGTLTIAGGIGPFAVDQAEVLNGNYTNVVAVTPRSVPIPTTGVAGFLRVSDLATTAPAP